MVVLQVLFSIIIAYCLGSVQSALIISKAVLKDDVRNHGSGSAGATNMFRTYGAKWGVLTLAIDAFKAFIAFWIGFAIGGDKYATLCSALAGMAVISGHAWPLFYGFKGGKGIAAALGLMLAVHPWVGIVCLIVAIGLAYVTGYMSVGSLVAILLVFIDFLFIGPVPYRFMLLFIVVVCVYLHKNNIKRLINGEENLTISNPLIKNFGKGRSKNSSSNPNKRNKRNLK